MSLDPQRKYPAWLIRHEQLRTNSGEPMYYSKISGFGDRTEATVYTNLETDYMHLPSNMAWEKEG